MFERIERKGVADQIASSLREAIVGGRLRAGDALPSERELATRYEVNRSSVREALRRLEAWGLVEIRQGGATRVRDVLVSAGLQVLPYLIEPRGRVNRAIVRDLLELRAMFLAWCAQSAAERANATTVARLDRLAKALSEARSPSELQQLDYDFFETLVKSSGNRVLLLMANVVREVYMAHRERFVAMYADGAFDAEHHREAVAAIRARNPTAAAAAMRAHALAGIAAVEEIR